MFSYLPYRASMVAVVLTIASAALASAQSPPDPDFVRQQIFDSYNDFKAALNNAAGSSNPADMDAFWNTLLDAGQVPYAQDNQVAFLYRGSASTVAFPGDHNGWNPSASSAGASRIGSSNVWINERIFPSDSRIDYKIVTNGNNWILDPANPLQIWGGFGPNSELRMPDYVFPLETVHRPAQPNGSVSPNILITSGPTNLGYDVNYRVYTPSGYDENKLADLPVVYFTDGHEYAVDHLGAAVTVMDNLIADGLLTPAIAVFVDPRNPTNPSQNRRASEYITNQAFVDFLADELVPAVDNNYRTQTDAAGRTILGTSLGGLNSAYVGATRSDTFENLAIQSPALWADPSIYDAFRDPDLAELVDIYMTSGSGIAGDNGGAFTMASILSEFNFNYTFTTANQGHSWGQWRGQIGEILIGLVGAPLLRGDANGDGFFDNLDIASFVLALTNPVAFQTMFPDVDSEVVLDMNGDGSFDNLDIAGFVAALTSGGTK